MGTENARKIVQVLVFLYQLFQKTRKEKEKLLPFVLKFGQGIRFLSFLDTVRAYQSAILVESKMKQYFSEKLVRSFAEFFDR